MCTEAGSGGLCEATQPDFVTYGHQAMSSCCCWWVLARVPSKGHPGVGDPPALHTVPFFLLPGNLKAKCSWRGLPTEKPCWYHVWSSVLWTAQRCQQGSKWKASDMIINHSLFHPQPPTLTPCILTIGSTLEIFVLWGNLWPRDAHSWSKAFYTTLWQVWFRHTCGDTPSTVLGRGHTNPNCKLPAQPDKDTVDGLCT